MWSKPHDFIHLIFSNSPDTEKKVADLYEKGSSFRDIEKVTGITKSKVRAILNRLQIPIRPVHYESHKATPDSTARTTTTVVNPLRVDWHRSSKNNNFNEV